MKNIDTIFDNIEQIKISNQKTKAKLYVHLFRSIDTKFGPNFLCFDNKNKVAYIANSLLKSYLSKIIDKLKTENLCYWYDDNLDQEILSLTITGDKKDVRTKKMMQTFDVKCHISNNYNTVKSDKVIDVSDDE